MKVHFLRSAMCFVLAASVTLTGCLKDKAFNNGEIQSVHSTGTSPKVIEIKLTAASTDNVHGYSYNNSNTDTVVDLIPVNLATANAADQDIHVTVVKNDSLVNAYNDENGTAIVIPTKYTIVNPGGVVTIPKGSHTGYLQVKFKPSDFLGTTYALGFTITQVAESGYVLSGNNQHGIAIVNIKNQYDGNYHVFGTRLHPTLGPFGFDYDADLNTTSINSNMGNVLADLGEGLTIIVNPDNSVSLVGDARDVFLQAGKVNKYDPATKTFTLNYYYNTAAPRLVTETLVLNP